MTDGNLAEQTCKSVHVSMRARTPGSYHDGGDHHGAVLQAGGVVGQQRGVLDQHQLVRVVPVADLSERRASAASVNLQTCSSSALRR